MNPKNITIGDLGDKNCILIGPPASGKTTFRNHILERHNNFHLVLSTDDILMEMCTDGMTYANSFELNYKKAEKQLYERLNDGWSHPVIWDQTNTTKNKIDKIKQLLEKSPFETLYFLMNNSESECIERNSKRPDGRKIPNHVIRSMSANLYIPDNYIAVRPSYEFS